jgi:hypothetical protein
MLTKKCRFALFAVISALTTARLAEAQSPVGTRASGMAGAFVAVADDATAVYWNPAGIATGSFVSLAIDFGRHQAVPDSPQVAAGQRDTATMVALSATAIGLAYYRLGTYGTGTAEPAVTGPQSREEVRRSVHALTTSTVGVSLLQSFGDHLVVGVTPKIMRGSAQRGVASSVDVHEALDTAKGLRGPGSVAFDVDAGAMISLRHLRLGIVARNLTTPAFAEATAGRPREESDAIEVQREVRVGAAWGSGWSGISRVTVSMDGDVTARRTAAGDRRDVAAGLETWWRNQRLGLRGGVRRSTIGDARAAIAAGISAGMTPGMLVEAHVVRGHAAERSWSLGARMMF